MSAAWFDSQTSAHKARLVDILKAVFGEDEVRKWTGPQAAKQMGEVSDVLEGLPVPTLSRQDRERIERVAKATP
jgi:hypothetical protein